MARGAESLKLRTTRPDKAVGLCRTNKVFDKDCKTMLKNVRNKCEISDKENRRFRSSSKGLNKRSKRGKKRQIRNKTWKDAHCKKVLLNIRGDEFEKRIKQLQEEAESTLDDIVDTAVGMGLDMVVDAGAKYAGKVAARHGGATLICGGAGAAGGSVVPVAGTAAGAGAGAFLCNAGALILDVGSAIWTVWDTYSSISNLSDLIEEAKEKLEFAVKTAERVQEAIDDPSKIDEIKKDVMDEMVEAGANDPCLKARKCFLVPYEPGEQGTYNKDIKRGGKAGIFDKGPLNLGDSRGCCPGQTGHHLIQDAWLKEARGQPRGIGNLCSSGKYDEGKAPVVCVEGMDHSTGSHGEIHKRTERAVLDHQQAHGERFSMNDAIDVAVEAHDKSVGGHCNKKCIKQQLKDYYDGMGCDPRPTDRDGHTTTPGTGTSGGVAE